MLRYFRSLVPKSEPAAQGQSTSSTADAKGKASLKNNNPTEISAMKKMKRKEKVKEEFPKPHLTDPMQSGQKIQLEDLQAKLGHMNLERSRLRSELEHARKEQKKMAHEYDTQIKRHKLKTQELSQQLEVEREECEKLEISHTHLQQTLGEIQERAFHSMDKGGWTAIEDAKIRDHLLRLQESIKKWAKNRALQLSDSQHLDGLSIDEKQEIMQGLSGYCSPQDWDQLVQKMPPIAMKRIPYLFAQAMLSKDIFEDIVADPFFTVEMQGQSAFPTTSQLSSIYHALLETNITEAHIWRSQMLRLLQSPDRVSKSDIVFKGRLQDNISRMSSRCSKRFLRGPVRHLLDHSSDTEQSEKALADIYLYAAQLALSLWTQRSSLKCLNIQHMARFFTGKREMIAHTFHHLDEEDTRLDGQPILAIVQPTVIAFGNDNAEYYEKNKVWAQGIVLIDERA